MSAPDEISELRREIRELEHERDRLREQRVNILEAWVMAMARTLVEAGIKTADELQERMHIELESALAHDEAFRGLRELFEKQGETDEPR